MILFQSVIAVHSPHGISNYVNRIKFQPLVRVSGFYHVESQVNWSCLNIVISLTLCKCDHAICTSPT